MPSKSKKRVFLSYAHENLDMVRRIYTGLKERKLDVWFDKEDLGPGLWKRKIEKAIPKSRYFIICISEAALKKTGAETPGFQDEELQQAYEIARVQPEDVFTVVPVRLEDCGRGDHRVSPYQQYDLFNDFEAQLDHLAIDLGGVSLADRHAEDTRSEDEKVIESLLGKGKTFYYAGDYVNSLLIFTSIISLHPDNAKAWENIGSILYKFNRIKEAIVVFEMMLDLKSNNWETLTNVGYFFFSIESLDNARTAFEKALEIRPDFAGGWSNLGSVLSALGKKDEAVVAIDKAIEINPSCSEAWLNKGSVLSSLGRKDDAIIAFDKALEINPFDTDALTDKGEVLADLDLKTDAISAYNNALEILESVNSPDADMVREILHKTKDGK
jgi:tetratricopeptide (TPR) repeat protein